MNPVVPWYITWLVVGTVVAITAVVWSVLYSAASRSGLPAADQRRVRFGTALFLGAWLGAVLILAPIPFRSDDPFAVTPLIPLSALALVVAVAFALWRSRSLRRVLSAVPLPVLIGLQVWRLAGLVFLVLLAQGLLPAHFALPAGWGDLAVGLMAPLVALALARGARGARVLGFAWNVAGLLDLVIAVGTGTGLLVPLLMPELGPRVPPAAVLGAFPMVLIPANVVPLSVIMHLLALGALVRGIEPGPRLAATAR